MKDKRQNKKKIFVSVLVGALLTSALFNLIRVASVIAWGPVDRDTYTMAEPADHAVFNSITDNAAVGDERNFVRVTEVNTEGGHNTYENEVHVVGGKDYEVSIYYHNNASATYNDAAHNYKGVAQGVYVAAKFPDELKAGDRGQIDGTIHSSTTDPADVWDEAFLIADENVKISYIVDSAKIFNGWDDLSGTVLPSEELFSADGTKIGVKKLNGLIPGCDEYSGTVVFRIHAEKVIEPSSSFEMEKKVSVDGGETWTDAATVEPGKELKFRIIYRNTGNVPQNVTVFDTLEDGIGMEYILGSTVIIANGYETMTTSETEIVHNDDIISVIDKDGKGTLFNGGVNIGEIAAGKTMEIRYRVKVKEAESFECGKTIMYNLAGVSARRVDEGSEDVGVATLHDKVQIEVNRDDESCLPEEIPSTGPAEIVLAVIIMAGLIVGLFYYINSKRTLNRLEAEAKGKDKAKKEDDGEQPGIEEE